MTVARGDATPAITVLSRKAGASWRRGRWRFALAAALGVSLLAALAAFAADWTFGSALRDQNDALTANLTARRTAIQRRAHAADDPVAQALDARKRSTPSAVVALEALSRALPDDAYLNEMRLQGDKLEIAGLATDAAALIRHIEQSPHFSRATFTAPTMRSAEDRQSFRIEAQIAPINAIAP